MIDEISEIKLNAVKFHILLNPESYMTQNHPLYSQITKWLYNQQQWDEIFQYAHKKQSDIIALCDDVDSISYLINEKKKIHAIEIHAVSLNDYFMLSKASKFPGKIFLGVGGSTLEEIKHAVDFLRKHKKHDISLMYGFQSYPTNYSEINLSRMSHLRDLFHLPIGYADHTGYNDPNNEFITIAAALMGFEILEKHFTLDYGKNRIDYHAAVGKHQMIKIKKLMKLGLQVFGNTEYTMSTSEKLYGDIGPMKKAIVAKKDIASGESLTKDDLWFKRTAKKSSIQQHQFTQLLGLKTKTNIKKDDIIDFSKLQQTTHSPRKSV